MRQNSKNKDKFIPLRKFSIPGVYSVAYLSQLVQRKKLKAKKIGRNYYTSESWFEEYLEKHSNDKKQENYKKYLNNKKNNILSLDQKDLELRVINKDKINYFVLDNEKANVNLQKNYLRQKTLTIALIMIIITVAVNVFFVSMRNNQGQVAGEEEKNFKSTLTNDMGTTTLNITK